MSTEAITLHPMQLTPMSYFRLLVRLKLRKSGWLYGLLILMGLFYLYTWDGEPLHTFITVFSLAWPLIMLVWLYAWAHRKDNKRIFEERRFVLDPEKLVGTTPGGGRSEIPWSYIQRTTEIDGRYLLYLTAGQMIILDKAAFPDAEAEQRFLGWLAGRKAQ